jgi:hypothetical protein
MSDAPTQWTSMNDIFALEETKMRAQRESRKERKEAEGQENHPSPSPTIPNHPQPFPISLQPVIAPQRDFNRRANSIERVALPSGLFPGASKKIYDAIYARTRGAMQPKIELQATKRDLMLWSGIRNIKTIETHIRHLVTIGLMTRRGENGDSAGFFYGIRLPEELDITPSPSPTLPNHPPPPHPPPIPNQKTVMGGDQKMVLVGEGKTLDNKADTEFAKTSFKTHKNDDEHTLTEFARIIEETVRDVCGGEYSFSGQERKRWRELARVLSDELRSAALRAESISSVPAFFTAHLRRRFARKTEIATGENSGKGKARSSGKKREVTGESNQSVSGKLTPISRFRMAECFRFAKHLYDTGQGIANPGGYATSIYRTGEADDLIEQFLHPSEPTVQVNIDSCPNCQGSGFWYPEGVERGVAKCKHERLVNQSIVPQNAPAERRLPSEDIEEQAKVFAELLESDYSLEQLATQFAAGVHPEDWQLIMARVEQNRRVE